MATILNVAGIWLAIILVMTSPLLIRGYRRGKVPPQNGRPYRATENRSGD